MFVYRYKWSDWRGSLIFARIFAEYSVSLNSQYHKKILFSAKKKLKICCWSVQSHDSLHIALSLSRYRILSHFFFVCYSNDGPQSIFYMFAYIQIIFEFHSNLYIYMNRWCRWASYTQFTNQQPAQDTQMFLYWWFFPTSDHNKMVPPFNSHIIFFAILFFF